MQADSNLIGMAKGDIETPALLIDLEKMEYNIEFLAAYIKQLQAQGKNVSLRPHIKTHKSPFLAKKQLAAGGAVGITCAKLEEAEVMIAGGITDELLIANQVVEPGKIRKLAGLRKHADIMCCVDNAKNIRDLSEAAEAAGVRLGVLIEVNVGMNRCGVDSPGEALELAKLVAKSRGLKLMGLQGYEGHLVNMQSFEERKAAVERDLLRLADAKEALEKAGFQVLKVDCAGTGTYNISAELPYVTEIQCGSYIFSDTNYLKVTDSFKPALNLLATIISRPAPARIITDVGLKALSNDNGAVPALAGADYAEMVKMSEEHSVLRCEPSCQLAVGDKVEFVVGHVCTTCNLHERYYGIRGGKVEIVLGIPARGGFR